MPSRIRLRDYLAYEWRIFPCHTLNDDGSCTCPLGMNCDHKGKHPRTLHGVKDATSSLETVEIWARQWNRTNWALATGSGSGVLVVDVDTKTNDGYASLARWEQQHGALPKTLSVRSGSGGRHLYFHIPVGSSIGNRVDWLPGVDIRANGGYVILPPSRHESGQPYQWDNWGQMIATAPPSLLKSIETTASKEGKDFHLKNTESILNGIAEGQRDDTLFRWACRLRRQHSGDADGGRAVVTQLVLDAAARATPPFPKSSALEKVASAFAQDHTDRPGFWGGSLTDVGNRNRFLEMHGENLVYVPESGWYQWDDQSGWQMEREECIIRLAEGVARGIREHSMEEEDAKERQKILNFADKSENRSALNNLVELCKGSNEIIRSGSDFNANPTDLACANGIIDLRTGELREYQRDDLVNRNTGVMYDPNADMTWWENFIHESVGKDDELIDYLQKAAGYTATGLISQECFFVVTGPPASGKSTFIEGLMSALGSYAISTQADTLMYRRGAEVPANELARFEAERLVSVSETRIGDTFNETLIKQLTGGDRISARRLYHEGYTFTPQLKLWIGSNHDAFSSDSAMVRRIKRIPFPHSVPADRRDPELKHRVRSVEGAQAILRWVVEGAVKFLKEEKLNEPFSIAAAAEAYASDSDVLGAFLQDRTETSPNEVVDLSDLYKEWVNWCKENQEWAMKRRAFRQEIRHRGYTESIGDQGKVSIKGLRLKVIALMSSLGL